ncbi:MAG: two-component regulator propeller domain-containing protein [bacterium]
MNQQYPSIYKLILLGVLLAQGLIANSQHSFRHFNTSNGLPHDVTYNMIQDSNGYIWICTDDGLSKFDGETFTNYNTKNGFRVNYITDIEEIQSNYYAISTWGNGLYLLKNDSIYKPDYFNDTGKKYYNIVKAGNTIIGNNSFILNAYDIANKKVIKKRVTQNSTLQDDINYESENGGFSSLTEINGTVYLHDAQIAVNNVSGIHQIENTTNTKPVFPFLNEYKIHSFNTLNDSLYIFGSDNKLIIANEYKILNSQLLSNIKDGLTIERIVKTPKPNEILLVISNSQRLKRLYKYNLETKEQIDFIDLLSIKSTISEVLFDAEGNLWISTFGDGVYCYFTNQITSKKLLTGNHIVDILTFKNRTYALSPSNIFSIDSSLHISKTKINGFGKQLFVFKDSLYVVALNSNSGTNDKFRSVSGNFAAYYNEEQILQDGYIFYNKTPIYKKSDVVINEAIYNNKWDLFTTNGKYVYNPDLKTLKKEEDFFLGNQSINYVQKKESTSYYATNRGFVKKTNDEVITYDLKSDLLSETINHFFIDDLKYYLATQKGLSTIEDNTILNYSKSNGLSSLALNKVIKNKDNLWIAGDNGIDIINTKSLNKVAAPELIVSRADKIVNYRLISYVNPSELHLSYKLNNEEYKPLTTLSGSLDFSSYKPGNYTVIFKTRKTNSSSFFSDSIAIEINAPWYTKWYYILSLSLLGVLTTILIFLRILKRTKRRNFQIQNAINEKLKVEKELNDVRENIAKDFHDDLGNKLASISLLSERLSKKATGNNLKLTEKIHEDANYLYKGTKDFIFSLKEQSNYSEEVILYLSDFYKDYCSQFNIEVEINDQTTSNIKLPFYWSKQIIYIFKEAITNVVKHADATRVTLNFSLENHRLKIELIDNGKGIDLKENYGKLIGSGFFNMKKRAQKINCHLEIKNNKNSGTMVFFSGKTTS